MAHPYITIDLDTIEHNARVIVALCKSHGVAVTGVTKGVCGYPEIAKAMLRGGVAALGESQLDNIYRLQAAGVCASYMLLRLPALSEVEEVVETVDVSLNSELAVLEGLSRAAQRQGRIHDAIIMVDLGDLREGVWPRDVIPFLRDALRLPGIRIRGLGTNLACFAGVVPDEDNMRRLVELADEIEQTFDCTLEWLSGLNSSGLKLLASGCLPRRVNHARIGEAILLGRETTHRQPWPETFQDAFVLHVEVLELKKKPSLPIGERGENAFGRLMAFENHGERERALLNVGREEVTLEGMTPSDSRFKILGASSSYLVVDMTDAEGDVEVGDELTFALNYGALVTAMTSAYVEKRPVCGGVFPETGVTER
jgi:predicted amino acid racemase